MALFKGRGMVWDNETDGILCVFKEGEFETSDLVTIRKLKDLGFEDLGNKNEVDTKIKELEETTAELKTGRRKKK